MTGVPVGGAATTEFDGFDSVAPAPAETELPIARELVRHGLLAAPAVLAVAALVGGAAGLASAGYALGLVLVNFLVAAVSLTWAGRISPGALLGTALGGYLVRLGAITAAVLLVRDAGWVDLPVLGATLIVSHLGLLAWELRSVSLTLASPGLKPKSRSLAAVTKGVAQ